MITAVRNAADFAALSLYEALRMASSYPSHSLGLDGELGYIRSVFRARFIELY